MVKDDDCINIGGPNKWYPYNFICHAVWAEVTGQRGWVYLDEAFRRLGNGTFNFYPWPNEGEQP